MRILKILVVIIILSPVISFGQNQPKQPHEVLIEKVVKALKRENARSFITGCIPTQLNFNELSIATYPSRPELAKGLQSKAARDSLIKKEKESFEKLIQDGKKDNIVWSKIKLKWTGIESKPTNKVNQLNLPFDVICGKKEYRIVLEYCTQLAKKPEIILPGELRWEGEK